MARRSHPSQRRPGVSNMQRVCAGCKEPCNHATHIKPLNAWLCMSCVIKLNDKVRLNQEAAFRAPDPAVKEAFRNRNGDRRHPSEEVLYNV